MRRMNSVVCVVLLIIAAFALAQDGDVPSTRPSKPREIRLVLPWRELTTLTDDQKQRIDQTHRRANEEIHKIETQEKTDILAILTDAQKAELHDLADKKNVERKLKAAEKVKSEIERAVPATQPTRAH